MKQPSPSAKVTRQKNLFVLVALLLIAVGFYFLTLVRMEKQSAHDHDQAPSGTFSTR
jgi:hypothetical protein